MSEIEKLNMIAEWQEQHKQLIEDLDNSKKRLADLEKEKSEIINLINDCLWSCVNKNFDKVEEGLKSLLNEYDE